MDDFQERIDKMGRAIAPYAKAKAERVYIENFMRSKKALLMAECDDKTVSAKEAYAYAHDDYIQLTKALRDAVETEEKHKWALERFKIEFEHWRTCQANDRWQRDRV